MPITQTQANDIWAIVARYSLFDDKQAQRQFYKEEAGAIAESLIQAAEKINSHIENTGITGETEERRSLEPQTLLRKRP